MTRQSICEYANAVRDRYQRANKKDKTRILDEFTKATRLHRKAAIRLLNRVKKDTPGTHRGRPKKYGVETVTALKCCWEAGDRLCSKRLHPFLPEMVRILKEKNEIKMTAEVETQIGKMSPSTIDRLLHSFRQQGGRSSFSTTRPGNMLRSSIAIKTFGDWQENHPGYLEIDTVAHCGESVEGFYLNTLMAVDVATGWIEGSGLWGKSQVYIASAIHGIRKRTYRVHPFAALQEK